MHSGKSTSIPCIPELVVQDSGRHIVHDRKQVTRFEELTETAKEQRVQPPEGTLAKNAAGLFGATSTAIVDKILALLLCFQEEDRSLESKQGGEYAPNGIW
jgi:hypothetical protein